MANLSLKNVTKIYRRVFKAVDDLSLEIDDKEFVVISGPSGSGKTALLRMLAGQEKVTSGEICVDGRRVDHLPMKQRDIALCSHDRRLNRFQTIHSNIKSGLKGLPISAEEADQRIRSAAEALHISQLLDRKPKTISEGEKQRVLLARALVRQPKVLLLDSPLSNLDSHTRAHLRTRISMIHKQLEGTFVMVTNDYHESMTMATRVIVLKDGKIQQSDTPQNLYDFPENLFVAQFIGEPEMNVIRVKLEVVPGIGVCAVFGENRLPIPAGKLQRFASDSYIGKEVYMGIRPENIHDEDAFLSMAEDSAIEVTVEHVELLGSETYLYFTVDGLDQRLVARVSPRSVAAPGERITLGFDTNRLHFFDAENEKTILMRI